MRPALLAHLSVFGLLMLSSCLGDSAERAAQRKAHEEAQRQAEEAAKKKKTFVKLDEENVVGVLTEFGKDNPETEVVLKTRLGDIRLRLYEETPLHRANFLRLVRMGFYEGSEFYRVIPGFMIQGGGSDEPGRPKIGKYTLPSEMREGVYHRRGALSMARRYEDNPEKRSSPYQFFIVQGERPYNRAELAEVGKEEGKSFSEAQYAFYADTPGAPHLDGEHTVFGEVISGMETVDKIAALETDDGHWPLEAVTIRFQIVEGEPDK